MSTAENTVPTVLVTGITGYVAGHLALQLLQKGYRVRGTLRSPQRGQALSNVLLSRSGVDAGQLEMCKAELLSDEGWYEAVSGCDYVMHTASPFPLNQPKDEMELIRPAKEGALRVLEASKAAGVKRVVQTSSVAAISYQNAKPPFTEAHWTDVDDPICTPYHKSKTLAERAAWAFSEQQGLELATINPGLIVGPMLTDSIGSSVGLVQNMMRGFMLAVPHMGVPIVDVRDVADAHIRAMLTPEAAGQRFITGGEFLWFREVGESLRQSFPDYSWKLPRWELPNRLVRGIGHVVPMVATLAAELDRDNSVSDAKAERVLGWRARPASEALRDTAQSLIDFGLV